MEVSLNDIYGQSRVSSEDEVHEFVFNSIKNGCLDLKTFIEYQNITQDDIEDCFGEALDN
jgi:hypothetical protein